MNFYENRNTKAFYNMAWISFVVSFVGMVMGLAILQTDFATKGFIAMSYLFSLASCFTVAKVVRDKHESNQFLNKIESAKTEKLLAESKAMV